MPNWTVKHIFAIAFLTLSIVTISRCILREQSAWLLSTYFVGFVAYLVIVLDFFRGQIGFTNKKCLILLGVGIALRLSLVGVAPQLSDDFWRFLWDGQLLINHVNPFHYTPDDFMAIYSHNADVSLRVLYEKLNSTQYYSVYPPVNQGVFAFGAAIFSASTWWQVVWIQVFLLCCEVGTIVLLWRYASKFAATLYALNPLVILEIVGNCHFEGVMIFFLLAALTANKRKNHIASAIWWTLAICSKLLPLMFLPIALVSMSKKQAFYFLTILALGMAYLFAPFFDTYFIEHLGNSLYLYFRQFEFNASLYYLAKGAEYAIKGYNELRIFGAILSFVVVIGVFFLAYRVYLHALSIEIAVLLAALLHIFCASVVHPWYITLPFALGCFALQPQVTTSPVSSFRKALSLVPKSSILATLWTAMVFFSYSHYANGQFQEYFSLIALEYGVLLCFILLWSYTE
jgi:hypothetical protein